MLAEEGDDEGVNKVIEKFGEEGEAFVGVGLRELRGRGDRGRTEPVDVCELMDMLGLGIMVVVVVAENTLMPWRTSWRVMVSRLRRQTKVSSLLRIILRFSLLPKKAFGTTLRMKARTKVHTSPGVLAKSMNEGLD